MAANNPEQTPCPAQMVAGAWQVGSALHRETEPVQPVQHPAFCRYDCAAFFTCAGAVGNLVVSSL